MGVDRAIIQVTSQIPLKQMDDKISYLAEGNIVALAATVSGKWTFAITADGIEVIENKEQYADKFFLLKPQPVKFPQRIMIILSRSCSPSLVMLSK